MKLYAANTTLQVQRLHYRLPEQPVGQMPHFVEIQPLSQVMVMDGRKDEIDHIVEQISTYGARHERSATKSSSTNPVVYAIDRPVDVDNIGSGHEENQAKIEQVARESRKIAAAATVVDQDAAAVDVEISEQVKPGSEKAPLKEAIKATKG